MQLVGSFLPWDRAKVCGEEDLKRLRHRWRDGLDYAACSDTLERSIGA